MRLAIGVALFLAPACTLVVDTKGLSGGTIDRRDALVDGPSPDAPRPTEASTDGPTDAAAESSPYASAVLADTPLAYYRFEETTTAPAHDSSGNGHDGTYVGSVDLGVPGALARESGTAIHLNGTTAWVRVGDMFHFTARAPMTLEAWVKPDGLTGYVGVLTNELPDYSAGYRFLLSAAEGFSMERIFMQPDARAASADTNVLPAPPLAKWSHLVATYDGTDVVLYVDGQEAMRRPQTPGLDPAAGAIFSIGARASGKVPDYRGALDEVAVYDHPLSAARVAAHHALGL